MHIDCYLLLAAYYFLLDAFAAALAVTIASVVAVVIAFAIAIAFGTSACKLIRYITRHSIVGNHSLHRTTRLGDVFGTW